jgi:hypothetical protein
MNCVAMSETQTAQDSKLTDILKVSRADLVRDTGASASLQLGRARQPALPRANSAYYVSFDISSSLLPASPAQWRYLDGGLPSTM